MLALIVDKDHPSAARGAAVYPLRALAVGDHVEFALHHQDSGVRLRLTTRSRDGMARRRTGERPIVWPTSGYFAVSRSASLRYQPSR